MRWDIKKQIASKITEHDADYVLGLKRNQKYLFEDVKLYFETGNVEHASQTLDKNHGRIKKREYFPETGIQWLSQRTDWTNLHGIGMVKSSVSSIKTGEFTRDFRYFITSLTDVAAFADAFRQYWSIESQLHWQLDVSFREDAS